MASAKNAKPTWRDVKAELEGFDRTGLLGLIKDLHGASRDNEAFLFARLGLGTDPLQPYNLSLDLPGCDEGAECLRRQGKKGDLGLQERHRASSGCR
jgi:hypothetical protein